MKRFQLSPLSGLALADEAKHRLGEDGALAVETLRGNGNVAVLEEVRLDDGLESALRVPKSAHAAILARRWSSHQTATWQNGFRSDAPSVRRTRSRSNVARGTTLPIRPFSSRHQANTASRTLLRLFLRSARLRLS